MEEGWVKTYSNKLDNCRSKPTREERSACEAKINREILNHLESKFGSRAHTCSRREAEEKHFGNFLIRTMDKLGLEMEDIEGFGELTCRRGANVVPVKAGGTRFFFKLGGTTGPADTQEILLTQQAQNISELIHEDAPVILNRDTNRGVFVTNELEGKKVRTSREPFYPLELADSIVFEAIIASWDRWNNLWREGKILKELDFGVSDVQTKDIEQLMNKIAEKSIETAESGVEAVKQKFPGLRKALKSDLEFYWKNKEKIKAAGPEFFDTDISSWKEKVVGEKEIDERMETLEKIFGIELSPKAQAAKERKFYGKE